MRTIASVIASAGDSRKSVKDMEALTIDNLRMFQTICRRPPKPGEAAKQGGK